MAISLSFHFEVPYLSPVRSNISSSGLHSSVNIMVTHLQRFRGLALSCDWLTRWVKLMTLMPVEKPRLMDHQPCLSKLHWIWFNIEMMSITFSSGTHIQYDSGHKGTKDRRFEWSSFYDKNKDQRIWDCYFFMMSKGLTIDWMEFYISFTWFLIEERK